MCGNDRRQILATLRFSVRLHAARCGGRIGILRSSGASLNTGVHVGTVVIADIHEIMTALHGTGERLQTDVISASVAAEGDKLVVFLDLSALFQCVVGGLDTGEGCARVFKCIVNVAVLVRSVRIHI